MPRSLVIVGIGLLSTVLLSTGATGQGITGKKLLLKSPAKMVLLSKDGAVAARANGSSGDPRCVVDGGSGLGGSVTLDDGTNVVTLTMLCSNWSTNASGTLYKYKDKTGVPKVGKVKRGLLKVASPAGLGGFPVPNGAATVRVLVKVGSEHYCMAFSGTGDGDKFLVKDTAASPCPCADSSSQICGGSCPSGQVCQPQIGYVCNSCGGSCNIADSCLCVPDDGSCAGFVGLGTCLFSSSTPFSFGPCPNGQYCVTTVYPTTGEAERKCDWE